MKEMSDEYKAAQARLMLEQASDVDIIVTTALIPGRKAPVLVTQEMLDVMKAGSVIVDLAAANGGNVAQTVPDEVITTANGVTIVGYTDLPSRLASTSSSLFGTNVAKFILSVGPQTTKEKGVYQIDLEDDAVQNMLVAYDGVRRYPDMITPFSPPPPKTSPTDAVASVVLTDEEMRVEANEKQRAAFVKNAAVASVAACALLAFGYANDSGDGGVPLLATFALAGLAGYQVVWGVAPALHSPLMAVTNAISGEFCSRRNDDDSRRRRDPDGAVLCLCVCFFMCISNFADGPLSENIIVPALSIHNAHGPKYAPGMTAVGGMLLLAQGNGDSTSIVPDSPAHWMGAIATTLSFVNIVGGFLITGKMLNLFRRKEDPDDFFGYYAVPAAVLVGGLGGSYLLSAENLDSVSGSVGIAAAICCISASKLSSMCEIRRQKPIYLPRPEALTTHLSPLTFAQSLQYAASSFPSIVAMFLS